MSNNYTCYIIPRWVVRVAKVLYGLFVAYFNIAVMITIVRSADYGGSTWALALSAVAFLGLLVLWLAGIAIGIQGLVGDCDEIEFWKTEVKSNE